MAKPTKKIRDLPAKKKADKVQGGKKTNLTKATSLIKASMKSLALRTR